MFDSIKQFAENNNIIWGVCGIDMPEYVKRAIYSTNTPFVSYAPEIRLNPALTLDGAKSVIVIGVPYEKRDTVERKIGMSAVSMNTVPVDYHIVVMDILNKLREFLGVSNSAVFSDIGPLVDKALAQMAGLGVYGKNGLVINGKIGSLFNIGYMIVDCDIEKTASKNADVCGSCTKCADNCPTGAITERGVMYERCISYVTQAKQPPIGARTLNGYIYGCDICQLVCPHNAKLQYYDNEMCYISNNELLNLSKAAFSEKYAKTGFYWRGLTVLQRNIRINIGN